MGYHSDKETIMGIVYTDITLKNTEDVINARRGLIKESEVRQTAVRALVDTGVWTLVINEAVRTQLGVEIAEPSEVGVAGGDTKQCGVTDPVTVCWQDRRTACEAVVLPNEEDVLLGALPLEGMDLVVRRQEVVGAHGDKIAYIVK
jgi:clan AA aspartic protease